MKRTLGLLFTVLSLITTYANATINPGLNNVGPQSNFGPHNNPGLNNFGPQSNFGPHNNPGFNNLRPRTFNSRF